MVITLLSCQGTLESTAPSSSGSGTAPGSGSESKARPNQRFRDAEVRAFHKCTAYRAADRIVALVRRA